MVTAVFKYMRTGAAPRRRVLSVPVQPWASGALPLMLLGRTHAGGDTHHLCCLMDSAVAMARTSVPLPIGDTKSTSDFFVSHA